ALLFRAQLAVEEDRKDVAVALAVEPGPQVLGEAGEAVACPEQREGLGVERHVRDERPVEVEDEPARTSGLGREGGRMGHPAIVASVGATRVRYGLSVAVPGGWFETAAAVRHEGRMRTQPSRLVGVEGRDEDLARGLRAARKVQ